MGHLKMTLGEQITNKFKNRPLSDTKTRYELRIYKII